LEDTGIMRLEPFHLERWLLNPCKYDLASAGIVKLRLKDIITEIDFDMVMRYGVTRGSDLIRQRIAELFSRVDKDNILITSGTAEANLLALYRLLEKGDEVLTILPTYMQMIGIAKSFGAKVRNCYLRENEGYTLDIEEFKEEITNKTKIICLVNPNNPIGTIIPSTQMRAICEIAEDITAWVLCDGALRGLEIDGNLAPTPVEIYEKGIATGSLSKIGLSGIRIGWLIADKKLVKECWTYKDYTTLSHSGIGEFLGAMALKRENISRFLRRAREIVRTHSAILCNWISENSRVVRGIPPKAGHTAFLKYNLDIDSRDLCLQLLKAKEVLVSPGTFFGSPRHLRVRYSCEREILIEGLGRLGEFLETRSSG
jgi:aspartate/methionine/tyrosine aminotransferase